MKILLVEDNEENRDALSRRLIRRGYEVVIAVDGKQGVELARTEHPDLILMDMNLPVMDGWEATRTSLSRHLRHPGDRLDGACHVGRPREYQAGRV